MRTMGKPFTDPPHNLSLRRAKRTGLLICIASLAVAGAFTAGLTTGSYWALAVPVAVGVFTGVFLAFWIGYTINTVKGIPAEADHYNGRGARLMATLLCLASLGVGALFVWGLLLRSYWALALPVAGVVLTLAAMVFWIGWAILTQRSTLHLHAKDAEAPSGAQGAGPLGDLGKAVELPADAGD